MQTELEQLIQADEATAMLMRGNPELRRQATEVLQALANLGTTPKIRTASAGALLQVLPTDVGH